MTELIAVRLKKHESEDSVRLQELKFCKLYFKVNFHYLYRLYAVGPKLSFIDKS